MFLSQFHRIYKIDMIYKMYLVHLVNLVNPVKLSLRFTRLAHYLQKLLRSLGTHRALPLTNRLDIDQIGSNPERRRTGTYKIARRLERPTARRYKLDLRQRSLQRFEITR